MKHIDVKKLPIKTRDMIAIHPAEGALCGVQLKEGDALVIAAMASDCNDCRTMVMVQPVAWSKPEKEGDVSVPTNVTPEPSYTPKPMVGFPSLEKLKKSRDGR